MRFTVLLSVVAVVLVAVNGESEPVAKAPAAVDAVMPTVDKEGTCCAGLFRNLNAGLEWLKDRKEGMAVGMQLM